MKYNHTEEEVNEKIEELFNSENGKKFISHLIRSFFPINKAVYLWSSPKDKTKLKCCITGHPLLSKDDILEKELNNTAESLKLTAKVYIKAHENNEEALKAKEELENFRSELYKGKLLAISSEESDKYFAPPAFDVFQNWLTNKILSGDSHINWLMKSHRKNETIKYAKENNIPITKNEEKVLTKSVNKPHGVTLSDNVVLQQLADKFKINK